MRIYELKFSDARWLKYKQGDVNDYDSDWGESQQVGQLFNYMTNNGYRLLGQGHFSCVYGSNDSSVVVKISKRPDRAWVDFVNFYYENRQNRHLPKVARKLIELDSGGNMFVAFLEHLQELDDAPESIQKALAYFMLHAKNSRGTCQGIGLWTQYFRSDQTLDSPKLKQNYTLWLKANPEFEKTFLMIIERAASKGFELDMKPDNFRYRPSDKKIVIVDPYYDENDCGP